jgi:hypothetical protein
MIRVGVRRAECKRWFGHFNEWLLTLDFFRGYVNLLLAAEMFINCGP